MIVLFTDFGSKDHYVGQMHAVIRRRTAVPVIDLLHHAPAFGVRPSAYLLDALQRQFQSGDVFVCVVDPGVGGDRAPVMMEADGKWFVGPDNGLLEVIRRRAVSARVSRIDWHPDTLSASFHGRDLFAPVAAVLAAGDVPEHTPWSLLNTGDWPDDLAEIIYIDHYGNAITGLRGSVVSPRAEVSVKGRRLPAGRTFVSASEGQSFWYRNSLDLVEIAAREASAAALLDLEIGDRVEVTDYDALLLKQ